MNDTPKLVVSSTLDKVDEWQNSTLLEGDPIEALTALKAGPGKNINIVGSVTLVRSLLRAKVLDELHLLVHPIAVGHGSAAVRRGRDPAARAGLEHDLQHRRTAHRLPPGLSQVGTTATASGITASSSEAGAAGRDGARVARPGSQYGGHHPDVLDAERPRRPHRDRRADRAAGHAGAPIQPKTSVRTESGGQRAEPSYRAPTIGASASPRRSRRDAERNGRPGREGAGRHAQPRPAAPGARRTSRAIPGSAPTITPPSRLPIAQTVSSTPAINRLPWSSANATMPSETDAKRRDREGRKRGSAAAGTDARATAERSAGRPSTRHAALPAAARNPNHQIDPAASTAAASTPARGLTRLTVTAPSIGPTRRALPPQ